MTLEDAKEILKKEGWTDFKKLSYRPKDLKQPEWEKPIVVEALEVCYDNRVLPLILKDKLSERLGHLRAEYENVHGMGQIDCKDGEATKGELLDKIKDLEKKNIILNEKVVTMSKELGAERCTSKILIEKFNEIRGLKKKLRKMRSIADGFRKEINTLTSRIIDFRKSIKEKDEVIEDISEELRLSKEREEELIATVKDYLALVGDKDEEIKKLKKQLANIVVNNVDAQALKSAESALVYKDKVIEKLKKRANSKKRYSFPEFPTPDIVVVKLPF